MVWPPAVEGVSIFATDCGRAHLHNDCDPAAHLAFLPSMARGGNIGNGNYVRGALFRRAMFNLNEKKEREKLISTRQMNWQALASVAAAAFVVVAGDPSKTSEAAVDAEETGMAQETASH